MKVTHEELVKKLANPGEEILKTLTPKAVHLWHMATGIIGEIRELEEGYQEGDDDNIVEELGDVFFYTRGSCQGLGINFDLIPAAALHSRDPEYIMSKFVETGSEYHDFCKKYVVYNMRKDEHIEKLECLLNSFAGVLKTLTLSLGYSLEFIQEENISKLKVRYEGLNFSNEAAEKRADKS